MNSQDTANDPGVLICRSCGTDRTEDQKITEYGVFCSASCEGDYLRREPLPNPLTVRIPVEDWACRTCGLLCQGVEQVTEYGVFCGRSCEDKFVADMKRIADEKFLAAINGKAPAPVPFDPDGDAFCSFIFSANDILVLYAALEWSMHSWMVAPEDRSGMVKRLTDIMIAAKPAIVQAMRLNAALKAGQIPKTETKS